MQFSKLRLTGFKSFVDPTDLVIADGLTGVVGPNGCGKSNLLEALRWVMGENRPTAMRGGGMEDVIFAGSGSRPARHFAEVSLQIDNSERLAPSGLNDTDTLDVVRRITRDIGSAYKLNGKDVRARDVQMLFADASTGAHSPALVRQGQISELINAKPKNRRRILEEAAGISGLYQRRHEAELKLKSTAQNLERVDDLIEALASQLAQLSRQARQAARYKEIGEALRLAEAQLLYSHWRDAEAAQQNAEAKLRDALTEAARAETNAQQALQGREAAEAAMPGHREEQAIAAALSQRLTLERDRLDEAASAAEAQLAASREQFTRLTQDIEREQALNHDAAATLEKLRQEQVRLSAASEGHEEALQARRNAAQQSESALETGEAALGVLTNDFARLRAEGEDANRQLERAKTQLAGLQAQLDKAQQAAQAEAAQHEAATQMLSQRKTELDAAERDLATAEQAIGVEEKAVETAHAAEAVARSEKSAADAQLKTLGAEVAALEKMLQHKSSDVIPVLDHIEVVPGFEAALAAAIGEELDAPLTKEADETGWRDLQPLGEVPAFSDEIELLATKVNAPGALSRRLALVGIVSVEQGDALQAALQPGQRLVSLEGSVWRWDGYRRASSDAPTATARRLEQRNRLEMLRVELQDAERNAEQKAQSFTQIETELRACQSKVQATRKAAKLADAARIKASRALIEAEAIQTRAANAVDRFEQSRVDLTAQFQLAQAEQERADSIVAALPNLEKMRGEVDAQQAQLREARAAHDTAKRAYEDLERIGRGRRRRGEELSGELRTWQARLEAAEERNADLTRRQDETERAIAVAEQAPKEIHDKKQALSEALSKAQARLASAADMLSAADGQLREKIGAERDAERAASDARELRARAETKRDAAQEALNAAAERIIEERNLSPHALFESFDITVDALGSKNELEARVHKLTQQRDGLGAVNLRAEEDAIEIQREHDMLVAESSDLDAAVQDLRRGISALNREGRERLLGAFDEVNSNFRILFRHLFGGGEANLVLVENDDPLEAGLEIMCQPPGKKLATLSLLSGGEQTLTALSLIFAVFLANPAPICVLDEVDAPLDDANVTRFCDLLDEMCRRTNTRFLIITHHAVTMSRMDRLFGVTMAEQGVSQLVSVDLKQAEAIAA